jgi:MYXO-CTERM domain-containing protein
MLWQPTGFPTEVIWDDATPPASTTLGSSKVGVWELARVVRADTGQLTLHAPTLHAYDANVSQVVKVPQFTTVTIAASNTLTASPWDGAKGGILVFLATGAVANNGTISADGLGFRGGVVANSGAPTGCVEDFGTLAGGFAEKGEGIFPKDFESGNDDRGRAAIATAGGGGDCRCAGGAGGGHAGIGGSGGNSYTDRPIGGVGGGTIDDVPPDRLVPGAGAGAGEDNTGTGTSGGAGGGVIFIRALQLSGAGSISASGTAASNAGAVFGAPGGGGAGGTVVLRFSGAAACGPAGLNVRGGSGGNANHDGGGTCGAGGGGGGGRIFAQQTGGGCSNHVDHGTHGTSGHDGTDGANGAVTASPPGAFGTKCAGNGDCFGATPICASPNCRACSNDTECAPRHCVTATGTYKGYCVECQADPDCTARVCDTTDTCVECVASTDCTNPDPTCFHRYCTTCTVDADCPLPSLPACQPVGAALAGQCEQCSASNKLRCDTDHPVCQLALGLCGCSADSDCGGPQSGRICGSTNACKDGCRGTGNQCPAGEHCSSSTSAEGTCSPLPGPDAGAPDVGTPDIGTPDIGTPDIGTPDTGTPDIGTSPDVGTPDIGTPDSGEQPDAGNPDAGAPDSGEQPDTGLIAFDVGFPDTGAPDAVVVTDATPPHADATAPGADGSQPGYDVGGCGCTAGDTSFLSWFWLALALVPLRRRR